MTLTKAEHDTICAADLYTRMINLSALDEADAEAEDEQ